MVAAALVGGIPALTAAPSAAATAADGPALTEGHRALAEALKTGQRVEVVGERTERATTYANPDGFSFTLEQSSVPVRVTKSGGGWQKPDATLVRQADGTVSPKAAAVNVDFSGGGSGDELVTITKHGRSLRLGWPGKLPAPELDGPSALYKNVLPDVDLKMTASVEGFRQVLVVKTPKAARNPQLREIDYGLRADGLTIRTMPGGALAATDEQGRTVFRAPAAQMWNSAGRPDETARPELLRAAPPSGHAGPAAPGTNGGHSGELHVDRSQRPGEGDTVRKMKTTVGRGSVSVVPDPELIRETPAEQYPLYIDPTVTWGESERTLLRSDGYESYGWDNGSDGRGQGVGKCGTWNGYYCGPGYVQKLYFEFSPASLKGKQVLDATFRATETWSFTCDARWVDLVRTNNISSSTTWSSRPTELDWMGDRYVSAGRGTACSPSQPEAAIEFHDNPEETNENLTPTVKDFAAGKFSRLTLELRAHDESDTSAWKRFKNDAVLAVTYVGLPDKPSNIGVVAGTSQVCSTTESAPSVVSDPTPALTATPQTMAGGESGAKLRVGYDIDHKNSDGTWSDTPPGNGDVRPTSGFVGDNVKVTLDWSTLSEGKLYRYRAWTRSYYDNGTDYLSGPSNASTTGWCYFKVDPTAPKAPKIAFSGPYTECTANACQGAGGPGVKGTFVFSPADGDTSNVAYQYRLTQTAGWTPLSGSTATAEITPDSSGTYRLYVQAKDNLGRWGAENVVDFLVAAGAGPLARWHFDESSGAALDATGSGHDASLGGAAIRDDRGRRGLITHDTNGTELPAPVTDKGLALDGSGGYAATSGQVLETRSSYTVSAWVRMDQAGRNRTFVSQNGTHRSLFYLGYEQSYGAWTFRAVNNDAPKDGSWSYSRVKSTAPATLGVWTHLTGVYDGTAKTVALYVNGRLQGAAPYTTTWASTGPLQIGRVFWSDVYTDPAVGSIDEVAVWQRTLSATEIADESKLLTSESFAGAELVADWPATQGSGTTIPDSTSGYGRTLTLSGGASLADGQIVLDGTDDAGTAPGPLVDDTGSFTVTTLAELDSTALASKSIGYTGQVLGQRTADGSSWGLWFKLTGKETVLDEETFEERTIPIGTWHFGRLNSDGTLTSVTSSAPAALDSAVRLTGVFDASDGGEPKVSLYLGHNRQGDSTPFAPVSGSGEFAVGMAFDGGSWQHHLPVRLTDLRVWAGAMASPTQITEFIGD
ncbi:LamG-like jellyroll fold domain-containing protein [Streptomyces vilmorinianum]|uniref:LamG-like jellyroll fold domain-containing protein n=1 Tax=Streptomyces vilmorinianum TaxID=3051092 RepID=UPI0010FB5A6F|nr:LamG-like jellyroll fold domain-containing protein [Streptomyces vilmorinianum]